MICSGCSVVKCPLDDEQLLLREEHGYFSYFGIFVCINTEFAACNRFICFGIIYSESTRLIFECAVWCVNTASPVIDFIHHNTEGLLGLFEPVVRKLLIKVEIHNSIRNIRPAVYHIPPDYARWMRSSQPHSLDKILLCLGLWELGNYNKIL